MGGINTSAQFFRDMHRWFLYNEAKGDDLIKHFKHVTAILAVCVFLCSVAAGFMAPVSAADGDGAGQAETPAETDLWANLETNREKLPDGNVRFSVTLSEKQAASFSRADMRILQQQSTEDGTVMNSYIQLWHTPGLTLNADRTISAIYPGEALYIVDDRTGEELTGPIDFIRQRDGHIVLFVTYFEGSDMPSSEKLNTTYYCLEEEGSKILKTDYVTELDSDRPLPHVQEESFFTESNYSFVRFRRLPIVPAGDDSEILGLPGWQWRDGLFWVDLPLDGGWHLEIRETEVAPDLLQAVFRVVDSEHHNHGSTPVRVFPELMEEYSGIISIAGPGHFFTATDAIMEHFLYEDSLFFKMRLSDLSEEISGIYTIRATRIALNESFLIPRLTAFYDNGWIYIALNNMTTASIPELCRIGFDLELEDSGGENKQVSYVDVVFPDPILLSHTDRIPIAETKTDDGLIWQLWGLRTARSKQIKASLSVSNPDRNTKSLSYTEAVIGGMRTGANGGMEIALGQTAIDILTLDQEDMVFDHHHHIVAENPEPLAQLGISGFQELRVFYEDFSSASAGNLDLHEARFCWENEIPYPASDVERGVNRSLVFRQQDMEIWLDDYTWFQDMEDGETDGRTSVALALWLENKGNDPCSIRFEGYSADGTRVSNRSWMPGILTQPIGTEVPAQAVRYFYLCIELAPGVKTAEQVSFYCFLDGRFAGMATVNLSDDPVD